MKQTVTENYDQIAFFADINTPGCCFACLLEKHQESALFFDMLKNNVSSVGGMFVLVEPDPVGSYLGRSLAHVTCKNRIIPLLHTPTLLPNDKINPGEVRDTRYFCKKHQTVKFSQSRTCSHDVWCNGTLKSEKVQRFRGFSK